MADLTNLCREIVEINKLRSERAISQQRIADMIGVTKMTYHRWENGKFKPSKFAKEKILEIIDVLKKEETPETRKLPED